MKKKKGKLLKIILIIIAILILAFLINVARKTFILNNILNKSSKISEKNNYSWTFKIEEQNLIISTFRKEDISISTLTKDNSITTFFKTGKLVNTYYNNSNGKTANLNEETSLSNFINIPQYLSREFLTPIVGSAVVVKISNTTIENKKCYLIESTSSWFTSDRKLQLFIDKETGLTLKRIVYDDNNEATTSIYSYEFDKVTDNDLIEPDRNEYEIIKK